MDQPVKPPATSIKNPLDRLLEIPTTQQFLTGTITQPESIDFFKNLLPPPRVDPAIIAAAREHRYQLCSNFVRDREGGPCDDKYDHGGATNLGIIQVEYTSWRKSQKHPEQYPESVLKVPPAQMSKVFDSIFRAYCQNRRCFDLPAGLDLAYVDAAFNMGGKIGFPPFRHKLLLINAVHKVLGIGVAVDIGMITPKNLTPDAEKIIDTYFAQAFSAASKADPQTGLKIADSMLDSREDVYKRFGQGNQAKFLKGWLNRVKELRAKIYEKTP